MAKSGTVPLSTSCCMGNVTAWMAAFWQRRVYGASNTNLCWSTSCLILALYQIEGCWGAVAKSNYVNLGFREPVHKSLHELVMTYFEPFVSIHQTKTLTGYTRPIDASRYTYLNWAWDEAGENILYHKHFYGRATIPLISESMKKRLNPVTNRAYKVETLYIDLNESFGNRPFSE